MHRVIAADRHAVPAPFRSFAVRSEEALHASVARAPYGRVHLVRPHFLDLAALESLAALGRTRMQVREFSDIAYAHVTPAELAATAPGVTDLVGQIAQALRLTGVLGEGLAAYRQAVAGRMDYLAAHGAGFHNDVCGHWTRCLFWNLALAVDDVEFVMPHAGVRLPLVPGDLMLFDQTMAHGLCRPSDRGQAVAASFAAGSQAAQIFLSGELLLTDGQWQALGSPWLPVVHHHHQGALELMAAQFDECSGAIQRPHALRQCLLPGSRYVDEDEPAGAADAWAGVAPQPGQGM